MSTITVNTANTGASAPHQSWQTASKKTSREWRQETKPAANFTQKNNWKEQQQQRATMQKKFNIKQQCKNSVAGFSSMAEVDEDVVRKIVKEIAIANNFTTSSDILMVQTTVLSVILANVPRMEHGQSVVIDNLANLIREVSMPEHKTDGVYGISQKTKTTNGYNLINSIYWLKDGFVASKNEYLSAVTNLITVCGCDILAKNDAGETALESYMESVRKNFAPMYSEMVDILSNTYQKDKLAKLVFSVINKANQSNVATLSNQMKYVFCLDKDLFISSLVSSLTNISSFKKGGKYDYIANVIKIYRQMFFYAIVKDDMFEFLSKKFNNAENEFRIFLNDLVALCTASVNDESQNRRDVFSALISEAYSLLNDHERYVSYIDSIIQMTVQNNTDDNQNILMTGITHMITSKKVVDLAKFFPRHIMKSISAGFNSKRFHVRIGYQIQDSFFSVTKKDVSFSQLEMVFDYQNVCETITAVEDSNVSSTTESMFDLDAYSHLTPKFIGMIDSFSGNELVDDWILYRKKELVNESSVDQLKKIINLIACTLNDVFRPTLDAKLAGFIDMMNAVYGVENVKLSLTNFKRQDDITVDDLFDLSYTKNVFTRFLSSYSL